MAAYEYDEAGVMATYFLITFLALILIPLTLSSFGKGSEKITHGCDCEACVLQRAQSKKREQGSLLSPKLTKKTYFVIVGWAVFAIACYRASQLKVTSKVYDPFEILGISSSATEKEIKSHYKKLSRAFHPDKVKPTAELTLEAIQDKFVQITKAYKSLTDETIRKNWLEWNNPDGPQSTSMGIALPKWIVESKNNIWVLGVYGLLFGGALPLLVGRWWFGNRQKTKDGIHANSAAAFFKTISEEATTEEVVSALGKAFKWEIPESKEAQAELDELEKTIQQKVGQQYAEVKKLTRDVNGELHVSRRRALILIYAHLTRLPINSTSLQNEQRQILLQTPLLLNALLNVSASRNWLTPTLAIMRINSYLAQALPPNAPTRVRLTQLPGVSKADIDSFSPRPREMTEVLSALEEKGDGRVGTVRKAISKWGRVEIVDAAFKVIGERVVAPSSIIFLVVKLRLTPPGSDTERKDVSVDEAKRIVQYNEKKDEEFLLAKQEAEDLPKSRSTGWAHAPHWPSSRKPTWWLVLGDEKQNRVVVPPVRISDIPYADPESDRDYRTYKIQFQGPPSTGVFTWKLFVVSDTFVAEEASKDLTLTIEHPPAVDQEPSEDEISEPDEDSLAGQMAAMRGGPVKKRRDEESDEESGTDDDEESDDDSSSDSDSD
ncbi:hypothetical protein MD484_g6889, partial [Candolleomyces efflorescens]